MSKRLSAKARCENFKICNSQEGLVLVAGLLLLLVATVVGITALSTSTTNVMIAGNKRLSELNFASADSGVSVSDPVIDDTAYNREVNVIKYPGSLIPNPSDFAGEISGSPPMDSDEPLVSPDLTFSLGSGASDTDVSVDVDYLYAAYAAGSAIEFASGYEGAGKGAGAGGVIIYYDTLSVGEGPLGSESTVCALYRYVSK